MRTRLPIFLLCFFALTACEAQAQQSTSKQTTPWEMQNSATKAGLRGIHAVGGGVAWASGTDGTVLRTLDGREKWQSCAMPPRAEKLDFRGVWAWDAETAVVMSSGPGELSRLYKTVDGCSSWILVFTNPDASAGSGFWDGLLFIDRHRGLVIGDPAQGNAVNPIEGHTYTFRIRMTHDEGETWAPVVDPENFSPGRNLMPLDHESLFAASNSAATITGDWLWFGTSKGRVLRNKLFAGFEAGGVAGGMDPFSNSPGIPWLDWQVSQTPLASGNDSSGVFSLAFRDENHGIAVGGDYKKPDEPLGTAAYTSNGGQTWTASARPPHGYRSSVAWDAADKAWIAVGTNGSDVSLDDGKTWSYLDSGKWNALSLPWVVGPEGRIGKLVSLKLVESGKK